MPESSQNSQGAAFPSLGIDERGSGMLPPRNVTRKRLEGAKREYIEASLGKGESWCTKVLNNQSGITLDDLPGLLDALMLKVVDKAKICFDPDIARSYEHLVRAAMAHRSLLFEDSE